MKNTILKKIGLMFILVVSACNMDGDLENPNEIGITGADVNLLMNAIQLDFADFYSNASSTAEPLMRMSAMTGGYRYQTAIQPQRGSLTESWRIAYQNVLVNAETMIPLAKEKNLTTHVAVARILEAYVYLTLVDLFGDVPQSEALAGPTANFNPKADAGESVYTYAISLLTEAKTELAKTGADAGAALTRDIYYGALSDPINKPFDAPSGVADRTRWNALANTLELKAWVNLSMITARKAEADAKIATLLGADLIDTDQEAFTYKYGTATVPVSRHPLYNQYYGPTKGSASGYICNSFLYELYRGKPDPTDPGDATKFTQDPRWRYYFYRQVGSIAKAYEVDPKSVGCSPGAIPDHYANGGYVFCTFDPGFYGRDHGDASGTPPDSPVITCAGVYPAGGRIDSNPIASSSYSGATIRGDGANGAGIQPIFMPCFTDFLKAEIKARGGDAGGAKTDLNNAIQKSIATVKKFASARSQSLSGGLEPSTSTYIDAVNYLYDNATNKLDVIGREFYVAAWGNGVEAYNSYRRTSAPRNMQPTLQINPGPFFRSLVYPADYVNLNSNAKQKDVTVTNKVFWDTNPETLN